MSWYTRSYCGIWVVGFTGCEPEFNFDSSEEAEAHCNYLNGGDGLTKRERFAMAAMSSLVVAYCGSETRSIPNDKLIASWSITQADALIAALDEVES